MKLKLILAFLVALSSCTIKENICEEKDEKSEEKLVNTRSISLSDDGYEHLANPYSLAVMQHVYDTYSRSGVHLSPTNLYLRIQPKDSSQLQYLLNESGLEIFDYPLDIELDANEDYVDASLSENDFPWLYTVVKPDYELDSNFKYEIIESCYIPEEGETITLTKSSSIDVEDAAYQELGYDISEGAEVHPSGAGKVYPEGKITVLDGNRDAEIPVKGVKIRGHKFVKYSIGYTDENGHYRLRSKFKNKLHYAIVFDNVKGFGLWGNYGPFAIAHCSLGRDKNTGLDKKITKDNDPKLWRWSAVNNAGYDYYKMCESTGIKPPPGTLRIMVFANVQKGSTPMMRHVSVDNSMWLSFFKASGLALFDAYTNKMIFDMCLPDITIGTGDKSFSGIYEQTSHELSHASHFSQVGQTYWGKYIDYIVNKFGYGDGKGLYAEMCGISEMWGYMMGVAQQYDFLGVEDLKKYEIFPYKDWKHWFKPHIFWSLYAKGVLTKRQIFDCLTREVKSFDELASKMYEKYPYAISEISSAFKENDVPLNVDPNPEIRNQTVTSDLSIEGKKVHAEGITVSNGATLKLVGEQITIFSPFTVQ